jgi:hypothetical protein
MANAHDNVFPKSIKLVGSTNYHNWKIHVKNHLKK